MKSKLNLLSLTTAALLLCGLSIANADTTEEVQAEETQSASDPAGKAMVASKEVRATVTNVDDKTRKITLQTEDGKKESIIAGDNIKNFNQIRKGDTVVANYTEALVVEVSKGGQPTPPSKIVTSKTARPGEMPAGMVEKQVNASVVVSAMNKATPSITFKDAAGDTKTMKVDGTDELAGIKVGDKINITYSEALAVRVEKPQKKQS